MKRRRPNNNDIFKKLDETFDGLDNERVQGLQRLQTLQKVKDNALQREKIRLEKKYGENHPRVQKINERLSYNQGAFNDLAVETQRASSPSPVFGLNTWVVHGHVVDQNKNPIKGVTVSLYDEKNRWIRQLGHTCSNEQGYYELRYTKDQEKEFRFDKKENLYLTITDKNHELLHRETKPVHVSLGHIDYRRIVIRGSVCVPPDSSDNHEPFSPKGS